jgi:ABC-type amino acid transport substrate-binding protein
MASRLKKWRVSFFPALCLASFLIVGCSKSKSPPPAKTEEAKQQDSPIMSSDEPPASSNSMVLPTNFGRRTGDLDEMVKQRNIRALVILSPIGFFYDKGQPRGVMYEALEEFEKLANQKLNTGKLNVKVTFLPMRLDQLEAALTEGVGDMIASGIVVTPEREKRVAFSTPIQTDVTQIIVRERSLARFHVSPSHQHHGGAS